MWEAQEKKTFRGFERRREEREEAGAASMLAGGRRRPGDLLPNFMELTPWSRACFAGKGPIISTWAREDPGSLPGSFRIYLPTDPVHSVIHTPIRYPNLRPRP